MKHATKFVMASLVVPPPAPVEVSGPESQDRAESDRTADVCPLAEPEPSRRPTPDVQPPTLGLPAPPEQEGAADGLFEAMQDPVRRRLLLTLCAAGGAHVAAICQRAGMGQKRVSRHLAHLRMRGLIHDRREGQHIWYTPAPGLVRYETHGNRYTLTHPSGEEGMTMFGPVTGGMATSPERTGSA